MIFHVSGGRGFVLGFQRVAEGFEFRALTAWGKKLLSSLAEPALMLRNVFLMIGAGRDCGGDGWGPSRYW